MPRSGTGTYTIPNTFSSGTVISSTTMNSNFADVAAALTQSVAADGQTPITGNFDWNGKNILNIGTLAASSVAMNFGASSGVFTAANGTSGSQVVNYSQFPATLTSTGTTTLPNGFIQKWGTGSTTAGAGSILFAAAFPAACHNVQISINGGSATTSVSPLIVGTVDRFGFFVWGNAAESLTFYWQAIGS